LLKRFISFLLPFVGLILFLYIVNGIGIGQLLEALSVVDPKQLWVFPAFVVFYHLVRGLRWQMLIRTAGFDYPYAKCIRLWSIGFFASSVTPGKVGDALRAYYLSRDTGHNFGTCLATVFADRVMDLVTILVGGLITTIIFSIYYVKIPSVWGIAAGVAGIVAMFLILTNRSIMRRVVGPLAKALVPDTYVEELREHFHSFYDALARYKKNPGQTALAYLTALVFWWSVVMMATAVTKILGIPVSPGYVLLIMPMLTLAEFLPISISGLGTRDAVAVYVFSVVGVASAQAVSFSILYLILGTYVTALVGFAMWLFRPRLARQDRAGGTSR